LLIESEGYVKVLAIQGSYRKNGNTAHIVQMILDHFKQQTAEKGEDFQYETVDLGHQIIGLCRGCRACFDLGEDHCPLKDDLLTIKDKIREADGVIVASPVYVDDVSGIMKNWIDRMAHVCHRPEFAGKYAYIVSTTGSAASSHAVRTMMGALLTWGFHISGKSSFIMGAKMPEKEIQARFDSATNKIARKMASDILENRAVKPTFFSLMMFKIYQSVWSKDSGTFDARYWQDKGWLDRRAMFYFPPRTNPVIIFLAHLTGGIIVRFVS
jgi:multimeric flavodoxin WrbA